MIGRAPTLSLLTCLALGAALPAAGQTSTGKADPSATRPGGTPRKAGGALGRVVRARGEVLVELPGKGWDPLKPDQVLRNGQRVKVGKRGALELTVADDARQAKHPRAYVGDRVLVRGGSELVVGPVGTTEALALKRGEVFAQSLRALKIRLGVSLLELGPGDARVELGKRGKATVQVRQHGKPGARLRGPSRELALAAGDRVRISPTGQAQVTSRDPLKLKLPKWIVARDALVTARKLLFREDFRRWEFLPTQKHFDLKPSGKAYEETWLRWPTRRRELKPGVAFGLPGEHIQGEEDRLLARKTGPMELRFGRSTPQGGLFQLEPGAVLRVTYRVSAGPRVRLRLTGTDFGKGDDAWLPGRTGLWTVIEFPLREALPQKNPITYLSFDAGAEGKPCVLEVREIVTYVPEGP